MKLGKVLLSILLSFTFVNLGICQSFSNGGSKSAGKTGTSTSFGSLVNSAPSIEKVGSISVQEGVTCAFQVKVSDADKDEVMVAIMDMPEGASFYQDTNTFKWIPNWKQAGKYTLRIIASDGKAHTETSATIIVKDGLDMNFDLTVAKVIRTESRNRGLVRYYVWLQLVNSGNVSAASLGLSIHSRHPSVVFIRDEVVEWVGGLSSGKYMNYSGELLYFDVPSFLTTRHQVNLELLVHAENHQKVDYLQSMELQFGIGENEANYTPMLNQDPIWIEDSYAVGGYQLSCHMVDDWMGLEPAVFSADGHPENSVEGIGYFGAFDGEKSVVIQNRQTGRIMIQDRSGNLQVFEGAAFDRHVLGVGIFSANSESSIVLKNFATGQIEYWPNDPRRIEQGNYTVESIPAHYQFKAIVDLTGDQVSDVVWYDTNTRRLVMWESGLSGIYEVPLSDYNPDSQYFLRFEDSNADNIKDLMLYDVETGLIRIGWMQDGVWNEQPIEFVDPAEWSFVSSGDFDGNGTTDFVFRSRASELESNASELLYAFIDGPLVALREEKGMPDRYTFFNAVGSVDVNGDGIDEILFNRGIVDNSSYNVHCIWGPEYDYRALNNIRTNGWFRTWL